MVALGGICSPPVGNIRTFRSTWLWTARKMMGLIMIFVF